MRDRPRPAPQGALADGRLFDSTQIHAVMSLPAPVNAAASRVPFPCLSGNPLRLAPPDRPELLADQRQRRHA